MSEKDPAEIFGDALTDAVLHVTDNEGYKKARQKFLDYMWDEIQCSIIDRMPEALENLVRRRTDNAIEALLKGQPDEVNRYLQLDGWTGRGFDHSVIHGELFVPQTMRLRMQVAMANENLLRDEVIADMKDQINALVEAVNKKDREIDALRDRLNGNW